MPTPYEYTYGDVKFFDLGGTLVLDTQASAYALYLVEDTEPSPDPKWVRVEVPGADGAVDLSRALTGQVQYATREIILRFAGSQATHALALGVVRTFRKLLHGQRLRIQTMLTTQVSGYYVADVECDGTADPSGIVEITVTATCDPFIRTGTQTLALTASTKTNVTQAATMASPNANLLKGAGTLTAKYATWTSVRCPNTPTTARLWWARTANLLDPTMLTMRCFKSPDLSTWTAHDSGLAGQAIRFGAVDEAYTYKADLISSQRTQVSLKEQGVPLLTYGAGISRPISYAIFLSGTATSVSSPSVRVTTWENCKADATGRIAYGTSSTPSHTSDVTITSGVEYASTLVAHCTENTSGSGVVTTTAITVSVAGITSDDLRVSLVAVPGSTAATTYVDADLGYVTVDFGGTWLGTSSKSDAATIYPWGEVVTTHNLKATANPTSPATLSPATTTQGSIDGWPPTDATLLALAAVDAYGDDCPECLIGGTYATIGTKTGSNTTMRSTPTVTTTGGAYVKLGGRVAIVPSGAQELQALTVPGGSFSVDYATLDGQAGTLTWEGGVL